MVPSEPNVGPTALPLSELRDIDRKTAILPPCVSPAAPARPGPGLDADTIQAYVV